MKRPYLLTAVLAAAVFTFTFSGCGSDTFSTSGKADTDSQEIVTVDENSDDVPLSDTKNETSTKGSRDNTPEVLVPEASGNIIEENEYAIIDVSNSSKGYFMVKYTGDCEKVKLQILDPNEINYVYNITLGVDYETFNFNQGDGKYIIKVMENIGDNKYIAVNTCEVDVTLENEFLPFLYPNQYSWFEGTDQVVKEASEIVIPADDDVTAISEIYHYVINNISYDKEKAQNVSYNYLPHNDTTLVEKKGICFDYASLMTAMLRSQRIPTKLEVGYSDEAYHAWISTYIDEYGWVDNIIEFDGESWSLMDPTLASNNNSDDVGDYIGEGSHYELKYSY